MNKLKGVKRPKNKGITHNKLTKGKGKKGLNTDTLMRRRRAGEERGGEEDR